MLTSVIFCPVSPDTHTKLLLGTVHICCVLEDQVVLQNLGADPISACPSLPALHRGQGVLSCRLNGWEAPVEKPYMLRKLCFKGRHGYVLTPKV